MSDHKKERIDLPTNEENPTIALSLERKDSNMAEFRCIGCEHVKNISFQGYKPGDMLRGVVSCTCGEQTVFEMKDTVLSFLPGKWILTQPNPNVPKDAKEKFTEARLCYFSLALRASAIMLRASVESGLAKKGITKGTLEERIEESLKKGIINQKDYTLAHGTRLVGNESVHESKDIKLAELLGLFGATTQILDRLFP